jgi:hypothetical protein
MSGSAVSPVRLLHLRLIDMSPALDKFVTHLSLRRLYGIIVGIIEFFDYLKRPAPRKQVAADDLAADTLRLGSEPGTLEHSCSFLYFDICPADILMEVIQAPACPFDLLQTFGQLAESSDCFIAYSIGTDMLIIRWNGLLHVATIAVRP